MGDTKTLTGFDAAVVMTETKLGSRVERTHATIHRGEALPDNVAPGEAERLEAMGAFGPTTKAERVRAAQRRTIPNASPNAPLPVENRPETPHLSSPPAPSPTPSPDTAYDPAANAAEVDDNGGGEGYAGMKKADLAAEADARGVDSSGTKADIIARLEEHDAAGGNA